MKKIILIGSLIGTVLLYILFNTRDFGICQLGCGNWVDKTQNNFLFFPIILTFSFATYFLSIRYFNSWWKFARIAIPIIFIISTLINLKLHHTSSSFMNLDDILDLPILFLMYGVFIVGSLWQIWKGYKNS